MDIAQEFKDNCGFGMMAHIKNVASRQMVDDSIEALKRMMHRGAIAADGKSGDGCGFLFSMPDKFMRKIATLNGYDLPARYAVSMTFYTNDEQKIIFEEACKQNDLKILFSRHVPVDESNLGNQAKEIMPEIIQTFVIPNSPMAQRRFEALLYLTRKDVESQIEDINFTIASFSDKVISYKGLLLPTLIDKFYTDLTDKDFEVSFAVFHQRFSTNTMPRWPLAQPFRCVAHNGEINSIKANRYNVNVNAENMAGDIFNKEEMNRLMPILQNETSDSGSFDNYFEFLIQNGVDFFKAVRSMVPPPFHNAPHLDAGLRSFYEYTSCNFEAWDGPAALNITNGRYVGTVLDRNGLRPAKYIITYDDRMIIASEYGIIDLEPENIQEQGKLTSGQMIAADLKFGKIYKNEEINEYIKNTNPYEKWLNDNSAYLMEHTETNFSDFSDLRPQNLVEMQRYHNYTNEVMSSIIDPMIKSGKEETGSMGDDTPAACFSTEQRNFTDFFRQKFAQVTNPPIDPLREKIVMSTTVTFGSKNNVLKETPHHSHRLISMSPIMSKEKMDILKAFGDETHELFDPYYRYKSFDTCFNGNLKDSLKSLAANIEETVINEGIRTILLDDRCLSEENMLMPMPMVIGYLNTLFLKKGIRSKVNFVAVTGEVMDSHSAAVLLGFGATAVYPYLLYASALTIIERHKNCRLNARKNGLKKVQTSVNNGILKIMSKMGISTVDSYINAALFDIIGLSDEIINDCFPDASVIIPGLTYFDIESRLRKAHKKAYINHYRKKLYPLEVGSFYKYMDNGEYHDFSPDVVHHVHKFARSGKPVDYEEYKNRINNRGLKMIRDFFEFKPDRDKIDISRVESIEEITKRFTSAAMSLGSISPEAHEAIAEAMNTLNGKSNSGEGGEDKNRFRTIKNSAIKQVASGRFGVTPSYLRSASEIQIKIAQGAKPGEGGQLPGSKVTPLIASLRFTIPGVTLISPPPHHDIYSIEDLAQLIFDLKQVNPKAKVSVKLVSTSGVGTIACGVAKAYADRIVISGADGGTGAAQLGSIKFAGNPWEPGLADAHQSLKANNLRENVQLVTDGGLKTGLDVVKAAILGAEVYGFGTALLSTVGCKILRVCHLNKCSVGIATQDELLRKHYIGTVNGVINYLRAVAGEVREILADLGYEKLDQIIGRTDLLKVVNDEYALKFNFDKLLRQVNGVNTCQKEFNEPYDKNEFEKNIYNEVKDIITNNSGPITLEKEIRNINRSFGAYISGHIAEEYGDEGLPKYTINFNLTGTAGQSFGAFLMNGISLNLLGSANDYVGKGMRGGQIIINPHNQDQQLNLAGNTCLYGATGGKLFVNGSVGERFAVRNSGALAVVEGTGDHACEYMTGGTVVILGKTGINFGAGMTGGVAFVYDKLHRFMDKMNHQLIHAQRIDTDENDEARYYLKSILSSYFKKTNSPRAKFILDHYREELRYFYMVKSKDMINVPLNPYDGN
ncbi:glutamate synthase large subunit [Marinigracilibium pacificum]|uniref:Glutamate synthase large subunit n=1 Tax=Marinigracilibium pacificum TaxID=2729599 RepID=A0A848IXK5_9BACT|nr:glutamate synthase large subunit [Marinigracilibium pacificum]NMM48015.1 glutamate synthase large subunit [Marinigracilibium pacificum]